MGLRISNLIKLCRVDARGDGLVIDVVMEKSERKELDPNPKQELKTEPEDQNNLRIQKEILELALELESLEAKGISITNGLQFLNSYRNFIIKSPVNSVEGHCLFNTENSTNFFSFLNSVIKEEENLVIDLRETERKYRLVKEKILTKENILSLQKGETKQTKISLPKPIHNFTILVESDSKCSMDFIFSYLVFNASWSPVFLIF